MSVSQWFNWILSAIVTSVNWLKSISLFDVPVLYILLSITIMGIVISALIYRAR